MLDRRPIRQRRSMDKIRVTDQPPMPWWAKAILWATGAVFILALGLFVIMEFAKRMAG